MFPWLPEWLAVAQPLGRCQGGDRPTGGVGIEQVGDAMNSFLIYQAVFPVESEVGRQMPRGLHEESELFTFYFLRAILEAFASQPPIRREKPPGM